MGLPDGRAGSPSCSPSSALNSPSLGLSPTPRPSSEKGPCNSPTSFSLPLFPSPPSISISSLPSPGLASPLLTGPTLSFLSWCSDHPPTRPPAPPPSYFLAVTSQRHPDVRPQITSRDLGFRSEILYFCTTGWGPGSRRRKHSPPCHFCLHLRGCDLPLPLGAGWGPAGASQGLRWALGPLGRATGLWPKCGAVQLCFPHRHGPSPGSPSCMNETLPPDPVTSPP